MIFLTANAVKRLRHGAPLTRIMLWVLQSLATTFQKKILVKWLIMRLTDALKV